jgi:hypothetical protein
MKKIFLIMFTILFIFLLTGGIFAEDEKPDLDLNGIIKKGDPIKAGMPDIEEVNSSKYNDNEHITKYASNYFVDVNLSSVDIVNQGLTRLVNILFSLQISLVQALIFLFDKALNFSAYKIFDKVLESFIKGSYHTLYDGVALIILSCLGFLYIVKMIQRREVEFWTGIVKVVIIVALGAFYYTNPLLIAHKVETASNELTNMVVKTSTDAKIKIDKGDNKDTKKKDNYIYCK